MTNKQILQILRSFGIGLSAYLLVGLFPPPAAGQASLPLTVSPARQELIVDPGEKTAVTIKFFNQGETPVSGLIRVADFVVEDSLGTPTIIDEPSTITGITTISPRFSAASWVSLPFDRITIAPKNKVMFQTKINVPLSARPGGRYLAVYFEPNGNAGQPLGDNREAVTPVTIRLASLVYLRVSGPVTEDAFVSRLGINRFAEYGPANVTTEILNRGDYHIRPIGYLKVTDIFGREVDRAKLLEQNIFPDTSRLFENKLGQKWMLGKYKAELTAAYGETGKVLTAIAYFWVVPWKLITIVILSLVILILLISTYFRKVKRHETELEEKIDELETKLEKKTK